MRENPPKFNPAVLPAEFMKTFEHTDSEEARHFLYPGQVFVTRDPITISTILGSCAAICLWDRHKKAGGMNHYLLPEGQGEGPNRFRYGNVANPELLRQVLALGCELKYLQAKIFGGSSAFGNDPLQSLGSRNVQLAEDFLRSAGIPVMEKDVSGKAWPKVGLSDFRWRNDDQEFRPSEIRMAVLPMVAQTRGGIVNLADFDHEAVLASFLVESEEGLDLMEQALVQMESSPSDPELLHSIFRVAHSIKGNATSLELERTRWVCPRCRGPVGRFSGAAGAAQRRLDFTVAEGCG